MSSPFQLTLPTRSVTLAALLVIGVAFGLPESARAEAQRNTPPMLGAASFLGAAEPDMPISLVLMLDLRDRAGAEALIAAQQDPDSPLYHQWIDPVEFQERFGPLPEDLAAAREFLESQGFENISTPTSTMIAAEGKVALVEQAFQVQIGRYSFDGRDVFANDRDPILPAFLADKVVYVGGLENLTLMRPQHGTVFEVDPGYASGGNSYILPRDNQVAYGQKSLYFDTGKKGIAGAEIAVASSWDIALADVNDQLTRQGGAPAGYNALVSGAGGAHTVSSTCVSGTGGGTGCTFVANGGTDDSVETNWDVSLVASIANDNHIGVYLTRDKTPTAFSVLYQYLADRAGTIKVVTHSWGACLSVMSADVVRANENALAQAAAGGQAWFVASGDFGSDDCHGNGGLTPDVDYPAASAYVTAVGGSEMNTNAAGSFDGSGWLAGYPPNGEAACSEGGGGEALANMLPYARPSWQSGTGVSGTYRLVPDVTLHFGTCTTPGAGKPYLVKLGASVLGIGGTSGSAPQWAAFWAVANQVVGTNLGHAAPTLFRILRNEGGTSYASSFHDVTSGNNGAYPAGAGYDKATGLGTPKFNALYPALLTLFAPVGSGCFSETTQADFQAGTATSVNTTASPGDVKLAIASGGEAVTAQMTTLFGGTFVTTTSWPAQTFTPTATGLLTRVEVALFCDTCSGANPDITVQLRTTSGGVPTSTILASTTIVGNASPASGFYTATFSSPASVTSGTVYAIVVRLMTDRTAGNYGVAVSSANAYVFGSFYLTTNSGGGWFMGSFDMGFKAFVATPATYAASGDLVSTIKDSNPAAGGTPHVTSLSWTGSTPPNTALKLQLATSSSPSGPFTFKGPDGTSSTYFTTSPVVPASELFQGRYFRWRAFLTTTDSATTPVLSAVTICYNNTCAGLPTAPVPSNNGPVCAGATLQLSASTIAGATYSWTGPNGFTSALQNPTLSGATAAAAGTYNVKAILGACQSPAAPTSVTIVATGGSCNDGNACTQTDTCQGGACVGSNPVVCPTDQCHSAGACNTATGVCSVGATRYNEPCNDGDPCTNTDYCGMRLGQNFDQAPGTTIPAPWTTSLLAGGGGDLPWRIDSSSSQSSPLSAFADDPDHSTDKVLVTPPFTVTSSPSPAYVGFFQRFQTENTYDGAVMEISINGGPFTDILAAGGSFIFGGYTGTISSSDGSPIAGRQAWTGQSSGWPNYQSAIATFPPAAVGQSVRLRWRFVSDYIVPSLGHWIDGIMVIDDYPAMTCSGLREPLPQEVGTILAGPDKVTFTFPAAPGASDYDAMRGLTPFLPVGPGGGDEACASGLGGTAFVDLSAPPVATAYWYLARGKNACGVGTWGTQSNGTPHLSTTCP